MRCGPFAPQQPRATPRPPSPLPPLLLRMPYSARHLAHSITSYNISHMEWALLALQCNRGQSSRIGLRSEGGRGSRPSLSFKLQLIPPPENFIRKCPLRLCTPPLATQPGSPVYSVPGRLATLHLTPLHKAATHASGLLVERAWAYCPCVRSCCLHLGGSTSESSVQPVCLCRLGVLFAATGVYKN